jgi:ABC-type sugar transport system permease subunit/ABC-type glycerol-3-phosphate transport system substrate-binding protein
MNKCLLLLLFLLVAPTFAHADAPVKLVVWGYQPDETNKADLAARVSAFEKQHPNINVSLLSMGAGAMNPQKLMTAIVGGAPPDLVLQDRFAIGDWASRGAFRPLDDLLQEDAHSGAPEAIKQQDYVPATWSEAIFQGHVYAIPQDTDDRVLYYNRALFRKAGLDPDKPPQTWDELIADAKKLTKRNSSGGYDQLGFLPLYGQGWLYLWSWQEDGEFMSPDGRRCTMDNPQTIEALTTLVKWEDTLGGVDALNAFSSGWAGDSQDPFLLGQIGMKVEGDGFLQSIAQYKPNMDFGVCPVPVPDARFHHEGRFAHDPTWVTWSGGFALAIPRGAAHVREAWQFLQWMNSPESCVLGAKAQVAYEHAKGEVYVSRLYGNNRATQAVFEATKGDLTPRFLAAKQVVTSLLPYTKFRPVTFVGQFLWDQHVRAVDQALRHLTTHMSPQQALAQSQARVQTELDAVYTRDSRPLLPTGAVTAALGALILAGLVVLAIGVGRWMARRRAAERAEAWAGFAFLLPWLFGFLVLTAGPIIASLVLSFCDYDVLHAPRWAGLSNYHGLVTSDGALLGKAMGNALYLAAFGLPLGMATSLAMALLLNTKVRGLAAYRTFFYMPSIVPIVASAVLWIWLLNADPHRGLINMAWQSTITPWFHIPVPGWLAVPVWAKPSLILMGLWGAGGGIILWLAGLQAIPSTLYEAAQIDGADGWTQFRYITLPMLSPYIFFNLIIGIIGALQAFDANYILGGTDGGQSTGPDDSLLVPVVYLFNNAFQYFKMGYASALAWLLFILILGLTLGQLKLAPRWVHYETDGK